jgi:hypothetical protein
LKIDMLLRGERWHWCDPGLTREKNVSEFDQVDRNVGRTINRLAEDVRYSLDLAGLPVLREGGVVGHGAEVEVDFGNDAAGGIYVTWQPAERLVESAGNALLQGEFDDICIQQSAAIKTAMKEAIASILESLGFRVDESNDDMRPISIRVTSRAESNRQQGE